MNSEIYRISTILFHPQELNMVKLYSRLKVQLRLLITTSVSCPTFSVLWATCFQGGGSFFSFDLSAHLPSSPVHLSLIWLLIVYSHSGGHFLCSNLRWYTYTLPNQTHIKYSWARRKWLPEVPSRFSLYMYTVEWLSLTTYLLTILTTSTE